MAIRLTLVVSLIAAALVVAGAARADADPASDTLYTGQLFLPYSTKVPPPIAARLRAAIARSRAAGRPVRVALIGAPRDLGGVPQLFGNPLYYARFLDAELQFLYSGRVLVVMPQGAGLAKGGRLIADKAVVAAKPGEGGAALARTATALVEEITTGKATALKTFTGRVPAAASAPRSSGSPVGWITGAAIALVFVLIAVAGIALGRRRRSA
jgi:hypothetical protein